VFKHHFACLLKAISSFVLSVMVLAIFSGCAQSSALNDQAPIKIGYSASLTGSFSEDGKALQQGFELWQDIVNKHAGLLGRRVQLIGLDDQSSTDKVKANYQVLMNKEHVDLLLGPYSSLLTIPAAVVANKAHKVLFAPTGNAPGMFAKHFNNVFVVLPPSIEYLHAFSYFVLSLPQNIRPRTIAYVSVDSPFAAPQIEEAKKILGNNIKSVYAPAPYPANSDVTPVAQQIADSQADVVVLGTSGLKDSISFIKAFKKLHFNPKALVETSGPDEGALFLKVVGTSDAEGVFAPNAGWYAGDVSYQSDQFTQAYLAKYGGDIQDISSTTAKAFGATQILEQAVSQANTLDNAKLTQFLHANIFNSIQGPVKFNADGANTIGVPNLFQWRQGKFLLVYPFNNSQVNPQYPKNSPA